VQLMNGPTVFPWKLVARDGADLPAAQIGRPGPRPFTTAGTTRDYEVSPTEPGTLTLSIDAFTQFAQPLQQPVLVTFRVRPP